ncbi:MAG: hypothetical protein WC254_04320 [Candidatus Woesearchaeota archaeon]|jgi:hypothetical protein
MTLDEQVLREKLLLRPTREAIVISAMSRYNQFLEQTTTRDALEKKIQLPIPKRVPDYLKYMSALEARGIVVRLKPGQSVTQALQELAPYQILRLEREYSIPAPLSQTLIKEPGISPQEAIDQIVKFYMRKEEEHHIVTVRRGLGRRAVQERDIEDVKKHMAQYRSENEQRIIERATAAVSDMPHYERLGLTRSAALKQALGTPEAKGRFSITNGLLEETHLTPEKIFAAAFNIADPNQLYLTEMYHGVERSRQHVLVLDNCDAAMRLLIYHFMQQKLDSPLLFEMSKPYANCVEGNVRSRSEGRQAHAVTVTSLPTFSSEENVVWRTPFDTELRCRCKDAEYRAELHAKAQYTFIYTDTHALALAYYAMRQAEREDGFVINPFPLPTKEAQELYRKIEHQMLIDSRLENNVYPANKAERERIRIEIVRTIGYERACTHNILEGYETIRRVLLR